MRNGGIVKVQVVGSSESNFVIIKTGDFAQEPRYFDKSRKDARQRILSGFIGEAVIRFLPGRFGIEAG